jgi:hypothetical protein
MRQPLRLTVAVLCSSQLLSSGCTRDSASSGVTLAKECGPLKEVKAASDLIALTRTASSMTPDLTAKNPLLISSEDFAPVDQRIGVRVQGRVAGLIGASDRVRILPGATFRLSFDEVFTPPIGSAHWVTFHAACRDACTPGERRCARNGVCYDDATEYCFACTDEPSDRQRCGCTTFDGADLPDGTSCPTPGTDMGSGFGHCRAGKCVWGP